MIQRFVLCMIAASLIILPADSARGVAKVKMQRAVDTPATKAIAPPVEPPAKPPKPPEAPKVDVGQMGLLARVDTAVEPPPSKKGYKVGQRLVFTIWIDNDDPYSGMHDVLIQMPRLPDHWRLDLSPAQPAYGNIFLDSGFPPISDTPAGCRIYYVSKPEGETRPLTSGTDSGSIQDVFWVVTRGNFEEVVTPHNANENMWAADKADVRPGVIVDADQLYVRYAVIVVDKAKKTGRR